MIRIDDLLKEISSSFSQKGMTSPRREAELLLCTLLKCKRVDLYHRIEMKIDCFIDPKTAAIAQAWMLRRLQGEPLSYICGEIEFYGCHLKVNPHVLIPRQETELLVDIIYQTLIREQIENHVLWDLCCGSGCIAIALKKLFPRLDVYASDISTEALELATANAINVGVIITPVLGDLLTPFVGKKAHYVVCNPPYISEEEYLTLDCEVKNYEPKLALVGGTSGLEFYSRLAQELPVHLHPNAKVWLEIGYRQGDAVLSLFSDPCWAKCELHNDWAGHQRFILLTMTPC